MQTEFLQYFFLASAFIQKEDGQCAFLLRRFHDVEAIKRDSIFPTFLRFLSG